MSQLERILIVDDNDAGRYLKTRVLAKAGYEVAEAATGAAARESLRAKPAALILLDVKLPDVNGLDLAREIKQAFPEILILQTSANFVSQQDRAAGLSGGADSYLIEPLDPLELMATVESLLRRYRSDQDLRAVADERSERIVEIGERLRTEIGQRLDAEEMLRHAQKLDVLGQLTGGIAHDFNNVLTIVIGNLESLRRQLNVAEPNLARVRTHADSAFHGAQRAIGITRQLLAFSRRQALEPKVLDVNAFISNLAPLIRQTLGEKTPSKLELGSDLWPVMCDPDQLETVLLNLVINSRDAMPQGGTLTLATENRGRPEDGQVVVTVRDTGAGMSANVIKYAFEPFFTTKDVGHGTGLGLAQVHGFMRQSDGFVTIQSEPGRGTAIVLCFPRYSGDLKPIGPQQDAGDTAVTAARPAHVLVVEDDEMVRSHSAGILREMGHTVLEASTGARALEALRDHPEINVLFSDVGLAGGMSGAELARKAKAMRPDLKVLFTTGYDPERLAREDFVEGAEILVKPFTYPALAAKIDGLMPSSTRSGSILMIEDEAMIRMDTAMSLRDLGFDVVEAGTVADGLKEIREHGAQIGAVVVDIGLPDGRGDDIVMSLRKQHEKMPVIITTGYDDPALHAKFGKDRCTKFLSKPYYADEVANALKGLGVSLR